MQELKQRHVLTLKQKIEKLKYMEMVNISVFLIQPANNCNQYTAFPIPVE
jgi:hypothetical protein